MPLRLHRPSHATVIAYLALFIAMSGTAAAATGGCFRLGDSNHASRVSTLANRNGVPLSLKAALPKPPLRVNSATKVSLLNADLLDGLHGRAFARKLCTFGPNDYLVAQTNCTRVITASAPLTNDGYQVFAQPTAPGGVVGCPVGFAVGGGYRLGESPNPDTVVASHGANNGRYQNVSWAVRLQPNPANNGAVVPGGVVFVTCIG